MRTLTTAIAAASLLVASLIACGGGESTPPPQTPTAPSATPAADAAAPATSSTAATPAPATDAGAPATVEKPKDPEAPKFASLPKDKKVEVMSQKVVPNLGKDFKEFDGKRFGTFNCATCHGPKKNEDPHKVLPKLTLSNGGFEKLSKKHPEMMKFMAEKVTPAMAGMMGEKPFDPATHQGFGCGGCHEVK